MKTQKRTEICFQLYNSLHIVSFFVSKRSYIDDYHTDNFSYK